MTKWKFNTSNILPKLQNFTKTVTLISTKIFFRTLAKIACEREECSFILVGPTERFWFPTVRTCSISETDFTTYDRRSESVFETKRFIPRSHFLKKSASLVITKSFGFICSQILGLIKTCMRANTIFVGIWIYGLWSKRRAFGLKHLHGEVVITPSSFWGTWCYSNNFRVLGVIKANPASFLGELGVIKVKSAKMTFCRNRKISQKKRNLTSQIRKKNPKCSNLVL